MLATRLICLSLLIATTVKGAPLTEARVTKIINIVDVIDPAKGAHPASLLEVIRDQIGLRTGSRSRSELMFNDNTLTRIGPETYFSFKSGTRDLSLQQGTLLLQVPKGIGGATIRTAAVTASITGTTIMMEYVPSKSLKVLVLEGSLRLARNGTFGDSLLLTPGKMVIMPPDAKHIPDPVSVDLAHIMKTSTLVNMGGKKDAPPLPSTTLINQEVERQIREKNKQDLIDTNLVILGHGTNVVIGSDQVISTLDQKRNADDTLLALVTGTPKPDPTPGATATPTPGTDSTPTPTPTASPSPTATPSATATASPTATATASPTSTPSPTGTPSVTPTASPDPTPLPTPDPSATPQPTPIMPLDSPPPVNLAVTLDNTKTIELLQPRITGGVNLPGSFYKGAMDDGPASYFVFGNSTTYDAEHGFDSRFGVNYDQSFPTGGVAVIRFASITFTQAPNLLLDGPTIDLALVGDTGITAGGPGDYSLNLSNLASLTLATNDGGITFTRGDFNAIGTTFKFLQFYQRGTGDLTLSRNISIPNASLYIDTQGDLTIANTCNITAARAEFNADGTLILNGPPHIGTLQLTADTAIEWTSETGPDFLFAYAPFFTLSKTLKVLGGDLNIGSGGIDATGSDLTGFDNVITTGDLKANNVTVNDQLSVGGTFFSKVTGGDGSKISAGSIEMLGGLSGVGPAGGGAGGVVTLNAPSILLDSGPGGINGIDVSGGDNATGNGGNGGTVNIGTSASPIPADVTINAPITATSGSNLGPPSGNGGAVNVTSNGTVTVNSTVKVSDSVAPRASKQGGNITITGQKTTGTAIAVSSSAQLLALLNSVGTNSGGTIKLTSSGGDVIMSGTTTADKGTVQVTNTGASGNVTLSSANLHGDTVKVGALGTNGTLNIGGGSIDAATTLHLYAGGSNGSVNFTDSVTLSGNSLKIIAADAVTIFNGKVVTVSGPSPASVFTNNPNYTGSGGNASTTGKFGGNGATTQPLSGAPGF